MISFEIHSAAQLILLVASLCLLCGAIGAFIMRARANKEYQQLEVKNQQLDMSLAHEKERYLEKIEAHRRVQKPAGTIFLCPVPTSIEIEQRKFSCLSKRKIIAISNSSRSQFG